MIRLRDHDAEAMAGGDKDEVGITPVNEPRSIAWAQPTADQKGRHRRHRTPGAAQPRDEWDDEEQADREHHRRRRRYLREYNG